MECLVIAGQVLIVDEDRRVDGHSSGHVTVTRDYKACCTTAVFDSGLDLPLTDQ